MAHRYGETILIRQAPRRRAAAGVAGAPAAFIWRGLWYQVDEILATWRLRDRWWAAPITDTTDVADVADVADIADDVADVAHVAADALAPTERTYYRVLCRDPQGEQVFDLYYDAATGQWVLDRVHD